MPLKNLFTSKQASIDPNDENREFKLMAAVVEEAFDEQKKARRWGILFKSLTFAYLFVAMAMFYPSLKNIGVGGKGEHTAIVNIKGPIMADEAASAGKINASLRSAFENEGAKGIILVINSPGGSPVQSGYVYDEILRLRGLHPEKKVYAVIEDIGASGAYYIAAAADEIYANRSSLVGSIGVTASGFGFVGVLEKLGVERRHYTSGEHKAFLDPFSPAKKDEAEFWQQVLRDTHDQFITAVKDGRGDRLVITEDVTSGLIWNGEQALAKGLIDGLGSPSFVAREIIGQEEVYNYTYREPPFKALLNGLGVSVGKGVATLFESQSAQLQMTF